MTSFSHISCSSGHPDLSKQLPPTELALDKPYRWTRRIQRLRLLVSLASIGSALGSAISGYSRGAASSLAFSVITMIISVLQLALSPEALKVMGFKECSTSSGCATHTTASPDSSPLSIHVVFSHAPDVQPISSLPLSSLSGSLVPVDQKDEDRLGEVHYAAQMVQTDHVNPSADGELENVADPRATANDWIAGQETQEESQSYVPTSSSETYDQRFAFVRDDSSRRSDRALSRTASAPLPCTFTKQDKDHSTD